MLVLCVVVVVVRCFFFFKQKTAYEMRISDWSSDVCSSDLFVRSLWALLGAGGDGPVIDAQGLDDGRWNAGAGFHHLCRFPTTRCRGPCLRQRNGYCAHNNGGRRRAGCGRRFRTSRSEEHTSELQSLMRISYAVFCLKKKNTQ